MRLTENFDREEFGDVPPQYEGNVIALASLLQHFRDLAGVPFVIRPGGRVYSSPEHNAEIFGAAKNSQHLTASAADGAFIGISNRELARRVLEAMRDGTLPTFGQFILYDYNLHTHISLPRASRNNQVLYARKDASGEPYYTPITSADDVPLVSAVTKKTAVSAASTLGVMLLSLALSHLLGGNNG